MTSMLPFAFALPRGAGILTPCFFFHLPSPPLCPIGFWAINTEKEEAPAHASPTAVKNLPLHFLSGKLALL
jgi:hypothetical protein